MILLKMFYKLTKYFAIKMFNGVSISIVLQCLNFPILLIDSETLKYNIIK